MGVTLDLRRAHRHQRHGDLLAILTWVNDSRALVVLPANRRDGVGWFIVDESAAWRWNINAVDASWRRTALEHCDAQSRIACQLFGFEPTLRNRARIINLVTDWIPDLLRMPHSPEPEMSSATFGQMVMRADGKVVAGEEIRVEREAGQVYG